MLSRRSFIKRAPLIITASALILPKKARAWTHGGGSAPYHADAVHFDGATTVALGRAVGNSNTSTSIIAFWKLNSDETENPILSTFPDNRWTIQDYDDGPILACINADNSARIEQQTLVDNATWTQIVISSDYNSAGSQTSQVLLNGVLQTLPYDLRPGSDFPIIVPWTTPENDFFICSDGYSDFVSCDLAQVYMCIGTALDFNLQSNIDKFISAGKPVDLLTSGAPTPTLLCDGNSSGFLVNKGSLGGTLILTGALTNASSSPSD